MGRGVFFGLFLLFLSLNFVAADFEKGNASYSIDKSYSLDSVLRGWINISLQDEPISSVLRTGFGDSKMILELFDSSFLEKGSDYDCIPTDCKSTYKAEDGSDTTSKTFTLDSGESKIVGLKFDGTSFESVDPDSFSINITSSAPEGTTPPLSIDIAYLDDGKPEWRPYKASGNFYSESKGCYDNSASEIKGIYGDPFCNRINIPPAPWVEVGAYITVGVGGTQDFSVSIDGEDFGCPISEVTGPGRISCVVNNFQSTELKEYEVCLETTEQSSYSYRYNIGTEKTNPCGYAVNPSETSNQRDFDIFAKPGKYQKIGSFILNNTELGSSGAIDGINGYPENVEEYIEDYISQKYNNDCSGGCTVPIKFTSKVDSQEITVSDVKIIYHEGGTPTLGYNKIYNVTNDEAIVNTDGFKQIYLDEGNFSVPNSFGNHSLKFYLNDDQIFSDTIIIEKAPQIRTLFSDYGSFVGGSMSIPAAYPIKFTVDVQNADGTRKITGYKWDFGDGNQETTSVNTTAHTYSSVGSFSLNITATDSSGAKSIKSFSINVKNPKDAVKEILEKKVSDFTSVKSQIGSYSSFQKSAIEKALKFSIVEPKLAELQQRENQASSGGSDSDYIAIMSELVQLNVPEQVNITKSSDNFIFYTDKDKINVGALSEVDGGRYNVEKEDLYEDEILSWNFNNVVMDIDFAEFSGIYNDYTDELVNVFDVRISGNGARNSSLFMVPKLRDLEFQGDYGEDETSGYYYIEVGSGNKEIIFSTTEDVDLLDLPVFLSPKIGQFSYVELGKEEIDRLSRQTLLILSLLLIIFLGFIAYIIMQEWYKRKYESHLFKNRNDLYNLISYIQSASKSGVSNEDMVNKLRKIGWGSEQINYVIRKYSGRRTGMVEILPLGK